MAGQDAIEASKYFRCQSCEEMKSNEAPRVVRPTRPACEVRFNFEVAVDVFEVHDAAEKRHSILSVVDMATHYHAAFWVAPGGTPSSRACAEAFNVGWLTPFGSPKMLTSDQGVHNNGRFAALLQAHGIEIRKTGARAPYQLGTTERHGGILKEIMKKAIHNRQLEGAETIAALCAECARTKNNLINHGGYSPVQWVLGHTPDDLTSLLSHDAEENLGIHQQLVDQEEGGQEKQESFMKQLLIRQSAKEAFMQVDTSQRIRKALLRKSVPMRGPYRTGDLVWAFPRRENGMDLLGSYQMKEDRPCGSSIQGSQHLCQRLLVVLHRQRRS